MRSEHIVPTSLTAQHNTRHKGCQSLRSDHVVPTSLIAQHNPAGRPHTRLPPTAVKRNLGEKTATCSEQAPILSASPQHSLHNHHKCIHLHPYRKVFSFVLGFLLVYLLPCCASHNASSAIATSRNCIVSQLPPHCRYDTWSRIQLTVLPYYIYYMTVCGRDNAWTPSQGFGKL